MTTPSCPTCHADFAVAAFLASVTGYSASTNSGQSRCPQCNVGIEFRISADALELGYTYWGGSMHFDSVVQVKIAGLRLVRTGESFVAKLDGATYPLSPPSGPA